MKKIIATTAFLVVLGFSSSALAAGSDVAHCAQMGEKGISQKAKEMTKGVSECATMPDCPMNN